MNKEQRLAHDILDAVGGIENVSNIIHCMTRVRLKIIDDNKIDYTELKKTDGVLGVVKDERLQVVVGPGTVNKVAQEMAKVSGTQLGEDISHEQNHKQRIEQQAQENKASYTNKRKQSKMNQVLKTIANIFIPLIPAFIGAGLIGGIAAVLNNFITAGTISADWVKQLVAVLNVIKDGMLAYLAIFTGFNAAKVFGATPGLGGVIGGYHITNRNYSRTSD